jgi:hypothetical protein
VAHEEIRSPSVFTSTAGGGLADVANPEWLVEIEATAVPS